MQFDLQKAVSVYGVEVCDSFELALSHKMLHTGSIDNGVSHATSLNSAHLRLSSISEYWAFSNMGVTGIQK